MICVQTPFVRQNTPHPRELKAKAHKLFTKGQNSLEDSDLQSEPVVEAVNQNIQQQPQQTYQQNQKASPEPELPQPEFQILPPQLPPEPVVGNGADESSEPSDDTDDVS